VRSKATGAMTMVRTRRFSPRVVSWERWPSAPRPSSWSAGLRARWPRHRPAPRTATAPTSTTKGRRRTTSSTGAGRGGIPTDSTPTATGSLASPCLAPAAAPGPGLARSGRAGEPRRSACASRGSSTATPSTCDRSSARGAAVTAFACSASTAPKFSAGSSAADAGHRPISGGWRAAAGRGFGPTPRRPPSTATAACWPTSACEAGRTLRSPSCGPAGPGCTCMAAGRSGGCGSSAARNARPGGRGVASGGAAGGGSIGQPLPAERCSRRGGKRLLPGAGQVGSDQ
jgi:hypothetical protein